MEWLGSLASLPLEQGDYYMNRICVEPNVTHEIVVEALGRDGKPVPGFRVYRAGLRLEKRRTALLYVRSGPSSKTETLTNSTE